MIGDAAFWVPKAHFDSYLAASKGAAEQRPPVSGPLCCVNIDQHAVTAGTV